MFLKSSDMRETSILVVDDQSHAREYLKKLLEKNLGCTVTAVNSGKEALIEVKRKVPDIILLDAMMPHMNGFDLCKRLRSQYSTRDTPIIFVTADNHSDTISKCIACGGSEFVTKPVLYPLLDHRMRTQLTLQHLQKSVRVLENESKDD